MGMLVDGVWQTKSRYAGKDGRFVRQASRFRDTVESSDTARHPLRAGRYHLYVSFACPWAHRVLITRALKGLEDALPVTVVDPLMGDSGWSFSSRMGCTPDPNVGAKHLSELYVAADPKFTGRVTVPTLWDKETGAIVNNESRDLVKMLDRVWEPLATRRQSLWPSDRDEEIGAMIDANYQPINNGVYRAGFATTQEAYEEAVEQLFERLSACEQILERQSFLCGPTATAADICLFTTLLRFEFVYHYHFKCNLRTLRSFPRLWALTRAIYQVPQVRATCRIDHIKLHYFKSHESINPTRIIPAGPIIDLDEPVAAELRSPFGALAKSP